MIKKPNLSETLVSKLQEEEAEVLNENIIEIDIETIMKEAIAHLKSCVDVECTFKGLNGNKVKLAVNGSENNITVLYDRLGIKGKEGELQKNNIADNIKKQVTEFLDANLGEEYTIKLRSMSKTDSIVFIYLDLKIPSIIADVCLTVKFYDDGSMGMRFDCDGDREKDERWSMSVHGLNDLLDKINHVRDYYKNKGNPEITSGK